MRIDSCYRYFALNFPGVRERIHLHSIYNPDDKSPIVVNAVRDNTGLEEVISLSKENSLVINFGGMQSPLGYNFALARTMLKCYLDSIQKLPNYDKVYICGGSSALSDIKQSLGLLPDNYEIGPLPQQEFLQKVATCAKFITVPGLSVVFEAIHLGKQPLFILPLNYSQHRQSVIYKNVLTDMKIISWEDVGPYETLPVGLPEHLGVAESFELGRRFQEDAAAKDRFRHYIVDFLNCQTNSALRFKKSIDYWDFNGAEQIAAEVMNEASKA